MFDQGSEIPLWDLHLPQDLRKLHWSRSKDKEHDGKKLYTAGKCTATIQSKEKE